MKYNAQSSNVLFQQQQDNSTFGSTPHNKRTSLFQSNITNSQNKPAEKKIVVLGNQKVGKTALIRTFVYGDQRLSVASSTIGTERYVKDIEYDPNPIQTELLFQASMKGRVTAQQKVEIWDTTGQEKFRSICPLYYRDADAFLIVFSLTDAASFLAIDDYFLQSISQNAQSSVTIALVATHDESMTQEQANNSAESFGLNQFALLHSIEVVQVLNPANGGQVEELFQKVAVKMGGKESNGTGARYKSVKLSKKLSTMSDSQFRKQKKQGGCCK
ncbi:hypothetical protein FGO68_gene6463 [Halteria grandinella]|uniref:Uncharacterized protein n=1 Tax=Halteria grandinella TaxID=5974 RepID=A0A8J8SZ86_HALGN|nr:hypothetical protein FGO68_gene6463 [Halteria grandinella]